MYLDIIWKCGTDLCNDRNDQTKNPIICGNLVWSETIMWLFFRIRRNQRLFWRLRKVCKRRRRGSRRIQIIRTILCSKVCLSFFLGTVLRVNFQCYIFWCFFYCGRYWLNLAPIPMRWAKFVEKKKGKYLIYKYKSLNVAFSPSTPPYKKHLSRKYLLLSSISVGSNGFQLSLKLSAKIVFFGDESRECDKKILKRK